MNSSFRTVKQPYFTGYHVGLACGVQGATILGFSVHSEVLDMGDFDWGSAAGVGRMGSRGHYGQLILLVSCPVR